MKKSQILGFVLWRGGSLLVGGYLVLLALRAMLQITDPLLELGISLLLAGGLFLLTSVVGEQLKDTRAEGSLKE